MRKEEFSHGKDKQSHRIPPCCSDGCSVISNSATAITRVSGRPRALWLSTADGAVETRSVACERKTHLPAVWSRGPDGAQEASAGSWPVGCERAGDTDAPDTRWSMDFVSARLVDGRWFRKLTVLDLFTVIASVGRGRPLNGIRSRRH